MATIRLRGGRQTSRPLTVELPTGRAVTGCLLEQAERWVLVLFADAPFGPGDVVTAPDRPPSTLTAVRHATLHRQPVTALEFRR